MTRFAILFICLLSQISQAEPNSYSADEEYGDAFVNYIPYIRKTPEKPKQPVSSAPVAKAAQPEQKSKEQKVTVQFLRDIYPKLLDNAIDNPTDDNVDAYLYTRRIVMDKSQRFTNAVMKRTNQDPLINENNRVPTASAGATAIRNANYLAQDQAVKELSDKAGLVVFVDGNCRFCAMQIPIIDSLHKSYGIEYLVVSTDGTTPKNYKGPIQKDNGLFQKLGLKLTPSIVLVPNPTGYKNGNDTNKYLVVSQGFYALDDMTKQIAYAAFDSQLLSKTTMAELDVWNKGVASTNDLNDLTLDPDKPETFKGKLQGILVKQYK